MYKPILFNTPMTKAVDEGRKTQTRRIVKSPYFIEMWGEKPECLRSAAKGSKLYRQIGRMPWPEMPYRVGDILWVRETWAHVSYDDGEPCDKFVYRASDEAIDFELTNLVWKWRPAIHMPKAAARIFLRVKDVRIERLNDISQADLTAEGFDHHMYLQGDGAYLDFQALWDETIEEQKIDRYGWKANPWVTVNEFEKIKKPSDWNV